MDTELLKTVGQIAGIGGIALGVFLLLFRELIRKSVFPRLSAGQASRLLTLIAVLVWSLTLAGIGAWVWTEQMPLFAVLVWSLALVGIGAWVWTEQTHRPDAQTEATSIRVQQGVGAGGSIKGSQITIATPPVNPTTSGFTAGTGIAVQGGVGAGADIENNRIDITPSGTPSGQSGGPQGQ